MLNTQLMPDTDLISLYFERSDQFFWLHHPNGEILESSPSVEHILGFTTEQLIGKNPYDYFHPDDANYIQKEGHEPTLDGKAITIRYRFRKADDSYIWLETKSYPILNEIGQLEKIFTISTPVSQLVAYQQKVDAKNEIFEQVGKMARIGAWELNLETKVIWWSSTTFAIHEVPEGFVPTLENAMQFYPGEEGTKIKKLVEKAITQGEGYDCVLRFITAKNRKIWVRAIGRAEILYGKVVKLYGVFQDINKDIEQKKEMEQMIEQLTSQKRQLVDFNQIVSHNLRTPVGNLSMLLTMLQEENDPQERQLLMDSVYKVSQSLHSLLDDLVDVVKLSNNHAVTYDEITLTDVLQKTIDSLSGEVKKHDVEIKTELGWDKLSYPALYLESIFLNLISNAIKYRSNLRKPVINLRSFEEDGWLMLEFTDNGSGIDLQTHGDKLFKLHRTFHKDRPGKGLGLFMTKSQIESLGGSIQATSHVDAGTSFIIKLMKK